MIPLWIPVAWMAVALTVLLLLFIAQALELFRKPKGDPVQAWDDTQQPGLYVVASSSESDRDICDAWIAVQLAHEHRCGAEG